MRIFTRGDQLDPRKDDEATANAADALFELQAKSYVGLQFLPDMEVDLYSQARLLNTGPIAQRLRFIVLAGELSGPQDAVAAIEHLREEFAGSEEPLSASDSQTPDTLEQHTWCLQ